MSISCSDAVAMVVADVRESYPEISETDAIEHVLDTVTLNGNVPGAEEFFDYGDELSEAYKVVLTESFAPIDVQNGK